MAIRYPRGNAREYELDAVPIEYGKSELILEGQDGAIISEGNMLSKALEACSRLKQAGKEFTLVNARFVKPLDEELLLRLSEKFGRIYTLEDNVVSGGFGSSILEFYSRNGVDTEVRLLGYDDSFIPHGEKEELYLLKKMDGKSIYDKIMEE